MKNNTAFAEKIRDETITEDEIMVSFDVVSLFTSIPVELALQVTRERLERNNNLIEHTNVSKGNIMPLLEFVLWNSYFTYEKEHYHQTFVRATIANLVMEFVEERAISTAAHPPRWWYRYVDDSHVFLPKEYVQEFHAHLISINPHNLLVRLKATTVSPF